MNKRQEKVLIATLCGLIVTAAAGFVVQPAMAAGTPVWVERYATVDDAPIGAFSDEVKCADGICSRFLSPV